VKVKVLTFPENLASSEDEEGWTIT
jgi:hypothetical protein